MQSSGTAWAWAAACRQLADAYALLWRATRAMTRLISKELDAQMSDRIKLQIGPCVVLRAQRLKEEPTWELPGPITRLTKPRTRSWFTGDYHDVRALKQWLLEELIVR
jgi:hypothetical protein